MAVQGKQASPPLRIASVGLSSLPEKSVADLSSGCHFKLSSSRHNQAIIAINLFTLK